jgi:hypothetical protein
MDGAIITLEYGDFRMTQTFSGKTVDMHLSGDGDQLRLTSDLDGNIALERNGNGHRFSMRAATPADRDAVVRLLSGATVIARLDDVLRTEWAQTTNAAAVVASARALIGILEGNVEPVARMAADVRSRAQAPAVIRARSQQTPYGCWETYSQDVLQFTYDLEACLAEAADSWNPLRTAWCAYEYNLKASFAFVWLTDCFGW